MAKRSGFEATTDKFLKNLKGVIYWYEPVKVPYLIPVKKANYIPDFVLYKGKLKKPKKPLTKEQLKDTILIETKGYFDRNDQEKMLAVKACNPDLDIRIVFQKDQYLNKLTVKQKQLKKEKKAFEKKRYSDWCIEHGFPFAIGDIPNDWIY
jgi:hypothetical protein